MPFKGLFIGIDRYASPGIDWLSCARRDATALHGLFTDTMGGETVLLTDEQATSAAIQEEFRNLATATPDVVVVIAFSGHGSETHEIVTYDTDPYDIPETSISLKSLRVVRAHILSADARHSRLLFLERNGSQGTSG